MAPEPADILKDAPCTGSACILRPSMIESETTPPSYDADDRERGWLRLAGQWTLEQADSVSDRLASMPEGTQALDASGVERLDSLGVLQMLRFARDRGLAFQRFRFAAGHRALVGVVDDVADGRMPPRRQLGVRDALARLGRAMVENWREARALLGFFGEVLIKLLR